MLVIMTDNGPQFVIYKFKECCDKVHRERIQVKTPNKNTRVESFYRILYSSLGYMTSDKFYHLYLNNYISDIEIRV